MRQLIVDGELRRPKRLRHGLSPKGASDERGNRGCAKFVLAYPLDIDCLSHRCHLYSNSIAVMAPATLTPTILLTS